MTLRALTPLALVALLGACAGRESPRTDSSAPVAPVVVATVSERGIGALRAGMTVAQARAALGSFNVAKGAESSGCGYATSAALPAGVRVMVENGVIGRVDVDTTSVPTAEGARVGDSEESVRALYGQRLATSPHKYTDGHYLTVRASAPADTIHRIIFEAAKGRVVNYRAGQLPQVGYVERCG